MHRSEPARSQQLCHAARIVAIGLGDHGGQSRAYMTRLHQNDSHAVIPQTTGDPLGKRSCFQANLIEFGAVGFEAHGNSLGITAR